MNLANKLADLNFFQIVVIADLEHEGKIYKGVKQYNNESILTPDNWEQHKDTFFAQQMAKHKDSYTLKEKIKLEIIALEKLPVNSNDYLVLKDRYKELLSKFNDNPEQVKPLFTISQIALKCVYENVIVTRKNAKEILYSYGHKSGDKLYNDYCSYSNRIDRIARPTNYTKRTLKNKISLFEGVVELLEKPYKQKAVDELKILKNYYESEFME